MDIICHECGHSIDEHGGNETFNGCIHSANEGLMCLCLLNPSDIARAREQALAAALAFYAEPRRYDGGNQRDIIDGDMHQPKDCPYLWDVTRDRGDIARAALAAAGERAEEDAK